MTENEANQRVGEKPFRRAVLRGLGVVLPPLLTILIFVWVISMTQQYVLTPVTAGVREVLVWSLAEIRYDLEGGPTVEADGRIYHKLDHVHVPETVYQAVMQHQARADEPMPATGAGVYRAYVELEYLPPYITIPAFLAVFILVLYLLGRFMAAGLGRFFWSRFERGIERLPIVRNVYSSVKQVSDFLFSEREVEYTRVVAVQYPSKGLWSLGLVTGESMLDIRGAAGEPVVSLLIPTSPMPMTGFTITVRKSETVDLNISVDQAFQFIVSCGVVIPPQQLQQMQSGQRDLRESASPQHVAKAMPR